MPLFGPPNVKKLKAKGNIKGLLKALGYKKDDAVRAAAAEALGESKDIQVLNPLVAALKDSSANVRMAAAEALGQIGDSSSVEPLIAMMGDRDIGVRKGAAKALGRIGNLRAVVALGRIGDSYSVEPLVAMMRNWDLNVRKGAAKALGRIGDVRAVEPLIAALDDPLIQDEAASALGTVGDVRAVEPLVRKLLPCSLNLRVAQALDDLGYKPRDDEAGVAYWAAKGEWDRCAQIGAAAVKPLGQALFVPEAYHAALKALVRIGAPAVTEFRNFLLHKSDSFHDITEELDRKCMVASALGQIGGAHAAETLLVGLNHYQQCLRQASAEALMAIGSHAVEVVGSWLARLSIDVQKRAYAIRDTADTDVETPVALVAWMEEFGKKKAVAPLLAVLGNKDGDIRRAAAEALVKLHASGELDAEHKRMILDSRSTILAEHTDRVVHGCGISAPHTDRGIGVDFSL